MPRENSFGDSFEHHVAIGIGSNIGDRQGNVSTALQRLREVMRIEAISPVYETEPVGYTLQPDFLNLGCTGWTKLAPLDLCEALARIERHMGRRLRVPLGPRAIDLDLLLYDDVVLRDERCTIPHPGLQSRPFVLVPLAEIAAQWRDPVSGKTIAELASAAGRKGVRLHEGGLLSRIRRDVQEGRPKVALSLDRAGVSGVNTQMELALGGERQPVLATLDIYADLDAAHSGVHMSRFSQDLEDALDELSASNVGAAEAAIAVAKRVVESQHAERSEARLRARFALRRFTPASALATREFYTLIARAVATVRHCRGVLGVEVEGITACPCAQSMVADWSRERLAAEGFDESQIAKILSTVPLATHNQRSMGRLLVGSDQPLDLAQLVEIVEQSMSSETYDLLKRPDELFVVNKAHRSPRFVEDVVREMLRYVADALQGLSDDDLVFARQVNFESIHKHDAVAVSSCTVGELRRELSGETPVPHTSVNEWLNLSAHRRPGRSKTP